MASTAPRLPLARDEAIAAGEGRWFASSAALEPYADRVEPAPRDRALWSVAEALFTTRSGAPPPARLAWLCDDLRDFLSHAGRRARMLFLFALWVCTWVAPFVVGLLPPFHARTLEQRTRILAHLEHGPMWQTPIILALKSILSILYFEHPDAAHEIGFDGACKGPEHER
jgi:hypothetical protein